MGNSEKGQGSKLNALEDKEFIRQLRYQMEIDSSILGPVTLLKSMQKPYDYYIRHHETFAIDRKDKLNDKLKYYQNLPEHKNVVKIRAAQIAGRQDLICTDRASLTLYAIYYNFTLRECIKMKLRNKQYFHEEELFYILNCLIGICNQYAKFGHEHLGIFEVDRVFLSPQGYLKIYPFRKVDNDTVTIIQNYQSLTSSRNLNSEMFQSKGERTQLTISFPSRSVKMPEENHVKRNNYLDIGIILLQLIFLNENNIYKDQQGNQKWNLLQQTASYKVNSLPYLKPNFRKIVCRLILEHSSLSLTTVKSMIQNVLESDEIKSIHCLKFDTEREDQAMIQSYGFTHLTKKSCSKEENFQKLKGLDLKSKLIPGRIQSLIPKDRIASEKKKA